jgi:hypothetical protein
VDLLGLTGRNPSKPQPPPPPYQFNPIPKYNPPDLGKPCCCSDPTTMTLQRNDPPPTKNLGFGWTGATWTLHESAILTISGTCWKDPVIYWTTCVHGGQAGLVGSGLSADVPVATPPIGFTTTYLTEAWLYYLACDGGKWTKKEVKAGLNYWWDDGWSHPGSP